MNKAIDQVAEELNQKVLTGLDAKITAKVDELIESFFDDAITKPFQPTNAYGEKIGEPTTLLDRLRLSVEEHLHRKKDRYSQKTIFETLLEEAGEKYLKSTVEKAIEKAKKQLVQTVNDSVCKELMKDTAKKIQAQLEQSIAPAIMEN